jgi:hypothetical protein
MAEAPGTRTVANNAQQPRASRPLTLVGALAYCSSSEVNGIREDECHQLAIGFRHGHDFLYLPTLQDSSATARKRQNRNP